VVQTPFGQVIRNVIYLFVLFFFLSIVHKAVVQNNIPAVFFEGMGRCCDLFANAFRLYNEYHGKFELDDEIHSK